MTNPGWRLAIIASLVSEMDKCVKVFQRDVAEHEEAVVPDIVPEGMWYHPNIRRGSPCGTMVGVRWFGCSVILIEKGINQSLPAHSSFASLPIPPTTFCDTCNCDSLCPWA